MKKIFVLLVAIATMFAQDVMAQQKPQLTEEERAARKARNEQMMQTRLELLRTELQLTDAQFTQFDPIYRKYRQEIGRVTSMNKEARAKKDEITNENALKVMSARLTNNILTSSVKQRYLLVFAEVIEPLQIMKLYRVDDKLARKAREIMKYRETAAKLDKK